MVQKLAVNTLPMVFLTRFVGPSILKREKKGAIINMTSAMAEIPVPVFPIYVSAKTFDDAFSYSISFEYPELDILTVRHMPTKS